MLAHLSIKHWVQTLGTYLFMNFPERSGQEPEKRALLAPALRVQHRRWYRQPEALSATALPPRVTMLAGTLYATPVESAPRRLAWLVKLRLSIEWEQSQPLLLPMAQAKVMLQLASASERTPLTSVYLQPLLQTYIPNANLRQTSLSPLIMNTSNALIVQGSGEFFLHASGGSPYFINHRDDEARLSLQLSGAAPQAEAYTALFTPLAPTTADDYLWSLA
jgi:hypothetical protein